MKILLVEDEQALSGSIADFFISAGHVCEIASNLRDALDKILIYEYEIIVVDIGLPDGSGLKVIEKLKELKSTSGILIISAKDAVNQKIEGLEKGADDYLAKPFHLAELHARIKSLYRRINFKGSNELIVNEININIDNHKVCVYEQEIDLTKKEFDLLLFLCSNINKVITKATISEHLWGDYMDLADSHDFIYSHIKNLRKKLASVGCQDYIKTIYSVGYKFSIE